MKVVIDTNVVISAVFFGGYPKNIVDAVINTEIEAFATADIVAEYREILGEMVERKLGKLNIDKFNIFVSKLRGAEATEEIKACRDPDDDKFISCAKAAGADFIISGDKDLLCLSEYEEIGIIAAKNFCQAYLL